MKLRCILLIIVLLNQSTLLAQTNKVIIKPEISNVTVYLEGAELQYNFSARTKNGNNRIIIQGLSPSLIRESIRFSVNEGVEINSITIQNSLKERNIEDTSILALKDSIQKFEYDLELLINRENSYKEEKEVIKKNWYIGGAQTGVSINELKKASDFFRSKSLEINNALTDLGIELTELRDKLKSFRLAYSTLTSTFNPDQIEAILEIESRKDSVKLEFKYLVNSAGWSPLYDLVTKNINEPVAIKYKAQVYNNTSINWNDVKLKLSTGDPTLSASRPYLTAWVLNKNNRNINEGFLEKRGLGNFIQPDSSFDFEEITVSELSTNFEISKPYSIQANAIPVTVLLSEQELQASFEYLAIPKIDPSAFLIAKVTGWENLNLIDGQANVYFGNNYVGESRINTKLAGDTLELSLGRDNNIIVTRQKLVDKSETKFIGTKKKESFVYEIQVKNTRKLPISIKIEDQIPISQIDDIVVNATNISNATLDKESGKLKWLERINPATTKKYNIEFEVKYPKNMVVSITKNKVVRTPRFRH